MQVVELGHARESGLEHFGEGPGSNGLDILGPEPIDERIHDFAPGPEVIPGGTRDFGKSRHGPLEGMAVQVRQPRKGHGMALVFGLRCSVHSHAGNPPLAHVDTDPLRPAAG